MHLRHAMAAAAMATLLLVTACSRSSQDSGAKATSSSTTSTIQPPSSTEPFPTTTTPVAPSPFVTLSGYGPLRFGMTLDAATEVVGATITTAPGSVPECVYATFPGIPKGMQLIFEDEKLIVIQVGSNVSTIGDLRVGSTRAEVEQALSSGTFSSRPNAYDADVTELYYRSKDPASAATELDFEIKDGKVRSVLAGLREPVERDEICS